MLLVLAMISLRVIIEPSIMFFAAGRDGWISYVFVLIVQIIGIFFISYLIKKNPQKTFSEVCEHLVGKVLTKIFMGLLFLFFLFKIIGTDYEMQNFLLEAIYDELNWGVFIIPVFLVMLYIAIKGPRVLGRLAEIFLPFAMFVLVYTFFISLKGIEIVNLLPVVAEGFENVFKGVFYGVSQMGEFLYLLMFMECIDCKKSNICKKLTITAIIVSVLITLFYVVFVCIFGDVAISLKEGIIRITQFADTSDIGLRIDGVSTVFWIPAIVIMSAVFYYCSGKSLMFMLGIKRFKLCVIITFIIVIILKFLPFITSTVVLNFGLRYFSFVSIALQIFIPAILFISQIIKKEKKNEKVVKKPA